MPAVAIQYREQILQEIAAGKRLSDIAPKLGVSENAISKVLKTDPEYRNALEASFEKRLDQAEDEIQRAPEQVDVSRARAYHDALKWRAGVEVPHRWGQRTQIDVNVDIGSALQELSERLRVANTPMVQCESTVHPAIEGECERK